MLSMALALALGTALMGGPHNPASTVQFAYGDARGYDLTAWVLDTKIEVRKRWALPYEARRRVGHGAIAFTVDRGGRVTDTNVEIPCDIPGFDDSTMGAIRAARLLALPDDYPGGSFALTLVFWFNETPFDVFDGDRAILDETLPATTEEPLEEVGAPAETQTESEIETQTESDTAVETDLATPVVSEPAPSSNKVFFTDGTSLEIDRLETRGGVVILHRRDGRLQSIPRELVDWDKTPAAR